MNSILLIQQISFYIVKVTVWGVEVNSFFLSLNLVVFQINYVGLNYRRTPMLFYGNKNIAYAYILTIYYNSHYLILPAKLHTPAPFYRGFTFFRRKKRQNAR